MEVQGNYNPVSNELTSLIDVVVIITINLQVHSIDLKRAVRVRTCLKGMNACKNRGPGAHIVVVVVVAAAAAAAAALLCLL